MYVLWLIDSLGPGGAESLMVPLLKSLKEYGVESRVCFFQVRAGNPIAGELCKIGIPVDQVEIKNLRNPMDLSRLMKYIRQQRPDIVHTQLEASDILGTLAARLLRIPSLATLHTMDAPAVKTRKRGKDFLRWHVLQRFAQRVIVVSESTRRHYLDLGITNEKMLTMYNGIDLDRFIGVSQGNISKTAFMGLPCDSRILTTVAVLREPKGIQYMLQALPGLLAQLPNLFYAIVGDGEYREALEKLTVSLAIKDHVVFLGYHTDIPEILAVSDLFVHPSLLDALPTVLFEAMAVGVPIVASQVGGVPEIIDGEITGLLVPPGDPASLANACLRLLLDKSLSGRLTSAAREAVANRFDIRAQAAGLAALYDQTVSAYGI
jgi:glycosyltransferase involved in cell wall biosynthesis